MKLFTLLSLLFVAGCSTATTQDRQQQIDECIERMKRENPFELSPDRMCQDMYSPHVKIILGD